MRLQNLLMGANIVLLGGIVSYQTNTPQGIWEHARTLMGSVATAQLDEMPTGTIGQLVMAQSGTSTQPPPAGTPDAEPKVDETALRYFARQGDKKRLDAEIARLRALYPSWTPPADPTALPEQRDTELDAMWKLYSEGKYADVRAAISDRQAADSNWQPPADLLDRLAVAEAREQIVNASNLKQYDTVVRVAAGNPSLLTCGDVDVLWRVAEAFAQSDRKDRAKDAYGYVLNNCTKPEERLATLQKAMAQLPRSDLNALLALERKAPDGTGEFASLRDDLARQSVANADADAKLVIPQSDIETVTRLARQDKKASDALLLGWYYVNRNDAPQAEQWFRAAQGAEDSASASQGLALALIDQNRPAEAEAELYQWRDTSEDTQKVYMAAVANLLAVVPPVPLRPEVLNRIVPEIVKARDAAAAQQLGWYADGLNQFETASQWFATALGWKPDDEPSAYGLTLMRWKLDNQQGVAELQRRWMNQSPRIAMVGQPEPAQGRQVGLTASVTAYGPDQILGATPEQSLARRDTLTQPAQPSAATPVQPVAPVQQQAAPLGQQQVVAQRTTTAPAVVQQPAQASQPVASSAARARMTAGCTTTIDPSGLSPQQALGRGWCLMNINRPMEAAEAFGVALKGAGQTREDAAYGQSLAYLRLGLSDKAAISATTTQQTKQRSAELSVALLSAQATGAYDQGRWVEAIMALDQRARIAPERIDLMVLRGYAYMKLRRFNDADRVFRAAAATGNRDALRGISAVKEAREGGVN